MTEFIRPEFSPDTLSTYLGYHLQIFDAVHKWVLIVPLVHVLLEGKGRRTGEASILNEYMPSYDHDWMDAEFGPSAEAAVPQTVMIDATYLKAHRTASSLGLKKGGVDA